MSAQSNRLRLQRLPVVGSVLMMGWHLYRRVVYAHRFRLGVRANQSPLRVVIGSEGYYDPGWIPSEIEFLNLLKPEHWDRYFTPNSIDALLAEHVWEHLTPEQGQEAARTCLKYLKPGGYLRVAVPDGFHSSPNYREWVRVGGTGPGADDHKVLYTCQTLSEAFVKVGFRVMLYEYFDSEGKFHFHNWDEKDGIIGRSKRFDKRNEGGALNYTSIVLDAVK